MCQDSMNSDLEEGEIYEEQNEINYKTERFEHFPITVENDVTKSGVFHAKKERNTAVGGEIKSFSSNVLRQNIADYDDLPYSPTGQLSPINFNNDTELVAQEAECFDKCPTFHNTDTSEKNAAQDLLWRKNDIDMRTTASENWTTTATTVFCGNNNFNSHSNSVNQRRKISSAKDKKQNRLSGGYWRPLRRKESKSTTIPVVTATENLIPTADASKSGLAFAAEVGDPLEGPSTQVGLSNSLPPIIPVDREALSLQKKFRKSQKKTKADSVFAHNFDTKARGDANNGPNGVSDSFEPESSSKHSTAKNRSTKKTEHPENEEDDLTLLELRFEAIESAFKNIQNRSSNILAREAEQLADEREIEEGELIADDPQVNIRELKRKRKSRRLSRDEDRSALPIKELRTSSSSKAIRKKDGNNNCILMRERPRGQKMDKREIHMARRRRLASWKEKQRLKILSLKENPVEQMKQWNKMITASNTPDDTYYGNIVNRAHVASSAQTSETTLTHLDYSRDNYDLLSMDIGSDNEGEADRSWYEHGPGPPGTTNPHYYNYNYNYPSRCKAILDKYRLSPPPPPPIDMEIDDNVEEKISANFTSTISSSSSSSSRDMNSRHLRHSADEDEEDAEALRLSLLAQIQQKRLVPSDNIAKKNTTENNKYNNENVQLADIQESNSSSRRIENIQETKNQMTVRIAFKSSQHSIQYRPNIVKTIANVANGKGRTVADSPDGHLMITTISNNRAVGDIWKVEEDWQKQVAEATDDSNRTNPSQKAKTDADLLSRILRDKRRETDLAKAASSTDIRHNSNRMANRELDKAVELEDSLKSCRDQMKIHQQKAEEDQQRLSSLNNLIAKQKSDLVEATLLRDRLVTELKQTEDVIEEKDAAIAVTEGEIGRVADRVKTNETSVENLRLQLDSLHSLISQSPPVLSSSENNENDENQNEKGQKQFRREQVLRNHSNNNKVLSSNNIRAKHSSPDAHLRNPLMAFSGYRFSPLFPSELLTSRSYANTIDCQIPLCPFELTGRCADTKCQFQHERDYHLKDRELIEQIICLNPRLYLADANQSISTFVARTMTRERQKKEGWLKLLLKQLLNRLAVEERQALCLAPPVSLDYFKRRISTKYPKKSPVPNFTGKQIKIAHSQSGLL